MFDRVIIIKNKLYLNNAILFNEFVSIICYYINSQLN